MDNEKEIASLNEKVAVLENALVTQVAACAGLIAKVGTLTETCAMIIAEIAYSSPDREARLNQMLSGEEAMRMRAIVMNLDLQHPVLGELLEGKESHRHEMFDLSRQALVRMILTRQPAPPA